MLLHILIQNTRSINRSTIIKITKSNSDFNGDKSITYYELQQRSNQIANYLRENDLKKGQRVSITMEREIDTIVWILGILKSGGVYVPIDPKFPEKE